MTTDELIAEIERLDQAATPGPWSYAKDWFTAHEGNVWCIEDAAGINLVLAKVPVEENTQGNSEDDARLIAAFRTLAVEAAARLREIQNERMEER